MPTVVPLYKRTVRRSAAAGAASPASTTRTTATSSPEPERHGAGHRHRKSGSKTGSSPLSSPISCCFRSDSVVSSGSSTSGSDVSDCSDCESGDGGSSGSSAIRGCSLCRQEVRYFPETLTCGHQFHTDCYWRWIRVRSNRPEEKSICPKCAFLTVAPTTNSMGNNKNRDRLLAGVKGSSGRMMVRRLSSSSDCSMSSSSSSSSSGCSSNSDLFFL